MTDEKEQSQPAKPDIPAGFLRTHWPKIFLALFSAYLVLLAIGVVAEMFNIQPVLDWWLWRPPGK